MIITEWEIFEANVNCCDAFVCSVILEAVSRYSLTPALPISFLLQMFRPLGHLVMAEDTFKDRLCERCYMKLQEMLPLIKSIIKSSGVL